MSNVYKEYDGVNNQLPTFSALHRKYNFLYNFLKIKLLAFDSDIRAPDRDTSGNMNPHHIWPLMSNMFRYNLYSHMFYTFFS